MTIHEAITHYYILPVLVLPVLAGIDLLLLAILKGSLNRAADFMQDLTAPFSYEVALFLVMATPVINCMGCLGLTVHIGRVLIVLVKRY